MAPHKPTRLIMIRHAQSVANAEHRVQGWGDAPLTEHGLQQVRHLADWMQSSDLGAHWLFSSPLQRAYQTAEAIGTGLGLEIQVRPGLREISLGQLEDSSAQDFNEAMALFDSEAAFERAYNVESGPAFAERILGSLYGLLTAYDGSTLIVVSHLGVICTALAYWLNQDVSQAWQAHGHIRNTAITELVFDGSIELVRYGELPHL